MSDHDEISKIEELIFFHRRRLHLLERRAAIEGISVDPQVTIQIEDTLEQIETLEQKRARFAAHLGIEMIALAERAEIELIMKNRGWYEQKGADRRQRP